jgi:hypothetical protein
MGFAGRTSPLYPDRGDSAVIIQPGGDPPARTRVLPLGTRGQRKRGARIRTEPLAAGPTLEGSGEPGEWLVNLEPGSDWDYTPNGPGQFPDDDLWERYRARGDGEKIGGVPPWPNGQCAEVESLLADPDWCMLLYYNYSGPYFTVWIAGFEWWAWVSRDGKRGLLMGGR